MAHIRSLQDFHTRHIGSIQTSTTEGIGAARKYIKDQLEIFGSASGGNLYTFEQSFEAIVTDIIQTRQYNIVGAISGSEVNAAPSSSARITIALANRAATAGLLRRAPTTMPRAWRRCWKSRAS